MKNALLSIAMLLGSVLIAQETNNDVKKIFEGLSDAWEQADGNAWGNYFSDDADFTVWFGLHLKGRREIADGHQWVFDTVYPNTRYEFTITNEKYLSPEIAVVHLDASIIEPGKELPEEAHTLPVAVVQKIEGEWKIVMFHNMNNRIKEIEEGRKNGILGDVRH
ncbi:uncharacterized protein (TIGR02246 family) [Ulvibacter sp. MAR_2010_11]|uniref:SgcJ/EcaC family oxidoreductase n=1 Tax=Ulvibacter sp. MAR_2010_11 TaxID=1250229 RepID=UPI000C2C99DF|nr:SgcJ/EcaC family oxidoreductase [Ulvibacter sp. MAR_2010_11]PKA84408.1 uncharacterized protein (TIGR02246 family) [Ulvibacter sp. MAR_2010_11]